MQPLGLCLIQHFYHSPDIETTTDGWTKKTRKYVYTHTYFLHSVLCAHRIAMKTFEYVYTYFLHYEVIFLCVQTE